MPEATFILSLDTEIAWGTYGDDALRARAGAFERYPALLRRLVRQLDIFEISATWAVVGHLLLPEGQPAPVRQPHYSFAPTPDNTRAEQHPAAWFYWPGLLDVITGARVRQEVGTHTYTHLLATDPGVSETLFDEQLAAVVALHGARGLPPVRSLVFPQNRVAYTHLLPKHGIIAYRGPARDWYAPLPRPLQRPFHLLDRALALPPPTYPHPAPVDGLVNLPASQFLMSFDGVRARIPAAARVKQAERGLQQAIARDEIFHLWFHPFNLGSGEPMLDTLMQVLARVWEHREAGRLRVRTMGEVAAACLD